MRTVKGYLADIERAEITIEGISGPQDIRTTGLMNRGTTEAPQWREVAMTTTNLAHCLVNGQAIRVAVTGHNRNTGAPGVTIWIDPR